MPDEHLHLGDLEKIPFTQHARRALALARDESVKSGHNYIGQEHLLLAFDRDRECTASRILSNLQFDARRAVGALIGPGDSPATVERGLTPRARKALELALQDSRQRKDDDIGTEHILLGMAGLGDGVGFMLLQGRGIGVEQLEVELANVKRGD